MKFIVCELESYFDNEMDQSMYKVSKPLQAFNTEAEADEVLEMFDPFYNYELRVVKSTDLNGAFR